MQIFCVGIYKHEALHMKPPYNVLLDKIIVDLLLLPVKHDLLQLLKVVKLGSGVDYNRACRDSVGAAAATAETLQQRAVG